MRTIEETIELINSNVKGAFAYENEDGNIEVTVRGKKSDKVVIEDNEVTFKGNCASTASEIENLINA